MKCDDCEGTGKSENVGQRCFMCNGSGQMCDICGGACAKDDDGVCEDCIDGPEDDEIVEGTQFTD